MKTSDLHANMKNTSTSILFEDVPFYNPNTGELLGAYSMSANYVSKQQDCIGTAVYSFSLDKVLGGYYRSSITESFTCLGYLNAITGGTGRFGCASGYDDLQVQNSSMYLTNLMICDVLCQSFP